MQEINQPVVESEIATDIASGLKFASEIGYPVIVRPAYTLVGVEAELLKLRRN